MYLVIWTKETVAPLNRVTNRHWVRTLLYRRGTGSKVKRFPLPIPKKLERWIPKAKYQSLNLNIFSQSQLITVNRDVLYIVEE